MYTLDIELPEADSSNRLPVYEVASSSLAEVAPPSPKPRWRDFADSQDALNFTGWNLAHAVIKADFLHRIDPTLPGIGFLLQSRVLIDWGNDTFSFRDGSLNSLSDFVKSSFSGRVGQGVTILFAHERGYSFYAHLFEYLKTQGIPTLKPGSRSRKRIADFIMDGDQIGKAIFEAKCSTRLATGKTQGIRTLLRKAQIEQVNEWLNNPKVGANKGYVVAACIGESSRPAENSLIFVDPDSDEVDKSSNENSIVVRRENYAAWLGAMGLHRAGVRLRGTEEELESYHFQIFDIAGTEIAIPFRCRHPVDWQPQKQAEAGISLAALKAIEAARQTGGNSLLKIEPIPAKKMASVGDGSLFPDGSYLGTTTGKTGSIDSTWVKL